MQRVSGPWVRRLVLAALGLATVSAVPEPELRAGDETLRPRVGVFLFRDVPELDATLDGLREGWRAARMEPITLERSAEGDESTARAALLEMRVEGVDLVIALGEDAALLARDSVRDRPVVFAAVGEEVAAALDSSPNACGVAGLPRPTEVVRLLLRARPGLNRLGIALPAAPAPAQRAAEAMTRHLAGQAETLRLDVVVARPAGETPVDRAADAVGALGDVQAVWVPPGVGQAEVEALAEALRGRGVLLAGSSRAHLDAGCAVVLCPDARNLGTRAVVLARRILAGEAPSDIPTWRPSRQRTEANLDACRRLGYDLPLALLAAVDHVSPAFEGSRR